MSGAGKFLMVMLAVTSLGVTAMITLKVAARHSASSNTPSSSSVIVNNDPAFQGGSAEPVPAIDPPILITLPPFTLTERSGKPAGTEQLRGKVWIADFVFTMCAGPCPLMTSQMAALQEKLAKTADWNDIRLVSLSVDPDRDTPEVLREYAAKFNADADHWLFLTGPRETMWNLTKDGFKLPVGKDATSDQMPIFHSEKFVLVDRTGHVRGFYDGTEAEGREKLLRDLGRVLKEKN